jgi:hypothetical protein
LKLEKEGFVDLFRECLKERKGFLESLRISDRAGITEGEIIAGRFSSAE